jgi:hypothetical protein
LFWLISAEAGLLTGGYDEIQKKVFANQKNTQKSGW